MNFGALSTLIADNVWQNQYTDTGWFAILLTLIVVGFVLLNIMRAESGGKRGKELYIRRIPGLNAIDEAVGRATEMGRPVVMVPGIPSNVDAVVMQALKIFSYVTRIAANFGNPILVCCAYAPVYTVATEMLRDVYQREGLGDKFDPDSVRFISDRQFAFAAGVSGLMLREQAAAVFLMGDFFAESLIFAETANGIGAIQVASSTQNTQTPFFIAACDYVLIGDEFYAASAYLTRQPVLVGSLIGQDWCKMVIGALIFLGMLLSGFQRGLLGRPVITSAKDGGHFKPLDTPHRIKKSETTMSYLFNPQDQPDLAAQNKRSKYPASQLPEPDDRVTNWN
ncbi:MAG: DUF6754 domain-containing protein [Fimbriimonadaceae bacterium]